jgi:hypothetical protein
MTSESRLSEIAVATMRTCHYCDLPIPDREKAIQSITGNGWAHFECWYDGTPFKRDPATGEQIRP